MLSKIKIPFHLLSTMLNGGSLDLDCYLTEITHSIKVAASAAVPSERIRIGTRKKGWSDDPELQLAKNRHKFWFKIWGDCDRPRSGLIFRILKSTKREYRKALQVFKRRQVSILSRDIRNHPQILWNKVSKFTSSSFSRSNPIDVTSWEKHFFSLFSDSPPPLDTTFRQILLHYFSQLDHS